MVFGELTSVYRSVQCVSKANIASFLACGLQMFYCEQITRILAFLKYDSLILLFVPLK